MTLKNIVPKEATDHNLLTFDEYYKYKVKFDQSHAEVDNLDQNQFLNDTKSMIKDRPTLEPVLEKLLKHIRNNGIFYHGDHKPCSYISYILSDEVENKGYEYETDIFNMFKEFLNKYNHRPKFDATICSNTLVHVDSVMYKKMNKLYGLYDLFKNHTGDRELGDEKNCPAFKSFVNQYNDFISIYQPNNHNGHYKKVLDNFANIIKEREELYKKYYICPLTQFHIQEIKLRTLPREEQHKVLLQVQQKQNPAEYKESQARSEPSPVELPSPAEFQATRAEHPTSRAEHPTSRADPETQLARPEAHCVGSLSSQEILPPSSHHAVQQQQQQQGLPQRETHQRKFPIDLSLESSQTLSSSEHYTYPHVPLSSNEVELPSSSFMNSITNTLKNVDPVPVIGVSGGMGALFLLFRYTPVGAFFRGGRGRVHRIPRSFNGPFPGGFPGYEEYDGGYIGYGPMNPLAE